MKREADISRLIDGELTTEQAATLRAQIDSDPELAELESTLRALSSQLADLPTELPPPLHLDPPIIDSARLSDVAPARVAPPARRWPWVAVAALAAALAIAVGPMAFDAIPAQTHLVYGLQHVSGDDTVYVGDLRIDVHGEANIFVEPTDPTARTSGQEDPMKPLPYLLAAAGGAMVTIAVLQGSALVFDDASAEAKHITEGQVHTAQSAGGPVIRRAPSAPLDAPKQVQQAAPEVTGYIADLERELDELKLHNSVLEGQIAARDGVAVDWPEDLPNGLTPDTFEATLRAVADEVPNMALDRIDCTEYPCLAVMQGQMSAEDARDVAQQVQDSLEKRVGEGDKLSARIGISQNDDGEGEPHVSLVIAPTPSRDGPDDSDLELRLQNRFNDAMQGDGGD